MLDLILEAGKYKKKEKLFKGLIQEKVSKLLKEKIIIFGSGRTDAGVHAIAQSAHFVCKNKILKCDKFLKSINHFLNRRRYFNNRY